MHSEPIYSGGCGLILAELIFAPCTLTNLSSLGAEKQKQSAGTHFDTSLGVFLRLHALTFLFNLYQPSIPRNVVHNGQFEALPLRTYKKRFCFYEMEAQSFPHLNYTTVYMRRYGLDMVRILIMLVFDIVFLVQKV